MEFDEFTRQVGLRVQSLRKRRGLSQEALAEAIGRSTDTVSNIERGFGSTRFETIFHIASVLGAPVAELFEIGPPRPVDRERRKLIEQLLELVSSQDAPTIEAVLAQAEILIGVKSRAAKISRTSH